MAKWDPSTDRLGADEGNEKRASRGLAGAARKRLEQNAYLRSSLGRIQIDERDGTLVLKGRVPSFYLKQVLQTTLGQMDGVTSIVNRIDVCWPDQPPIELAE